MRRVPIDTSTIATVLPLSNTEIQETGNVKHTITLDHLAQSGVEKDGIPAIDDPSYEPVFLADQYLRDEGLGIVLEIDGEYRFYPYQILVWHKVVNDTFRGRSFAVTYSPLSRTGLVFETDIKFGVSEFLYDNNVLLYDRETDSLWSQIVGKAVSGDRTGDTLEMFPSTTMKWKTFRDTYRSGEVLSRDTGAARDYTRNPYTGYSNNNSILFPLSHTDDRLLAKQIVYGFVKGNAAETFPEKILRLEKEVSTVVGDQAIVVIYDEELDSVKAFKADIDGEATAEKLALVPAYWFAFVAAYPHTSYFVPEGQGVEEVTTE